MILRAVVWVNALLVLVLIASVATLAQDRDALSVRVRELEQTEPNPGQKARQRIELDSLARDLDILCLLYQQGARMRAELPTAFRYHFSWPPHIHPPECEARLGMPRSKP